MSGAMKSMWVEGVNIAGVTNTVGSQGGYADFTWLGPGHLDRAADANELVPGFSRQNRNVDWTVWIDLNRDGIFSADDILLTAQSDTAVSGSLVIPAAADAGLTRMRVIMHRNDVTDPCQGFRAGEVEDYAVVLLP